VTRVHLLLEFGVLDSDVAEGADETSVGLELARS
jgi:hypothetical protein